MSNKILKQHVQNVFNEEKNYEEIMKKINNEHKNIKFKKILSIAAIFLVIILGIGTFVGRSIYLQKRISNFYISSTKNITGSIETMTEEGYMEKVNMDYVTQDGVSIKVDSVVITDNYFEAVLNIKVEKEGFDLVNKSIYLDKSYEDFYRDCIDFAYVIYDEDNNIYATDSRILKYSVNEKIEWYSKYVYNQLGIKYKLNDLNDVQLSNHLEYGMISKNGNNIIMKVSGNTAKQYPRSKKLYIRVADLGNTDVYFEKGKSVKHEDHLISDAEWIFEIDIPEKFYERETIALNLQEDIEGLNISKFVITEKNLTLNGTLKDLENFITKGKDDTTGKWGENRDNYIYISDEYGNQYIPMNLNTSGDEFKCIFGLNKTDLENKLYLNVMIDGVAYTKEILIK